MAIKKILIFSLFSILLTGCNNDNSDSANIEEKIYSLQSIIEELSANNDDLITSLSELDVTNNNASMSLENTEWEFSELVSDMMDFELDTMMNIDTSNVEFGLMDTGNHINNSSQNLEEINSLMYEIDQQIYELQGVIDDLVSTLNN